MLKAEELRIGNLVMRYSNIMEVSGVSLECADLILLQPNTRVNWRMLYSDIFGIPLTEEWLLKLGFENAIENEGSLPCFKKRNITIAKWIGGKWHAWYKSTDLIKSPQHVHHLQNLHFYLCGEELIISTGE